MYQPFRFLVSAVTAACAGCAAETGGLAPAGGPDTGVFEAFDAASTAAPDAGVLRPLDAALAVQGDAAPFAPADANKLCNLGTAESTATASSLDLFGSVVYFSAGKALPAGSYRAVYEDGCMKYNFLQGWTVHSADTSGWWLVGADPSVHVARPPGTTGVFPGQGAFSEFAACVAANKALPPTLFQHAGGKLGIYLDDVPYVDNVAGMVNPRWRLELLGECPILK